MNHELIFSLAAVSFGTRLRSKEILRFWRDRPKKVFDLGCGVGTFCRDLINKGISPIGMEYDFVKPQVGFKTLNTPFLSGDITNLPFKSGSIPVAFVRDVLEHLPDDNSALIELKRCLQPGGSLIITGPTQNMTPFYNLTAIKPEDHGHLRLYNKRDFVKQLSDHDFKIVETRYIHNPLATLLEFIILKLSLLVYGEKQVKQCQMTQATAGRPISVFFFKLISQLVWPLIVAAEYISPEWLNTEILVIARKK